MRIGPLGIWELLIIFVVVLVIFGPRRLPEMAKGVGQAVREFRRGVRDMSNDLLVGDDDNDKKSATTQRTRKEPAEPAPEA